MIKALERPRMKREQHLEGSDSLLKIFLGHIHSIARTRQMPAKTVPHLAVQQRVTRDCTAWVYTGG